MLRLLFRKLLSAVALLVVVTAATFTLMFQDGPGAVRRILGAGATDEQVAERVHQLGLDEPVFSQYVTWLGDLARGDLGSSYFTNEPVTDMMSARMPITVTLLAIALLLTTACSVVIGVTAAVRGGWLDRVLQVVAVIGSSVPNFVVAIGLAFTFAITLPIFPPTGYVAPEEDLGRWALGIVLPVVSILLGSIGSAAQQFRGAMIDTLRQDYVRTLRSRGVPERAIVYRHALKNAAGPGLTVLSLQTIALIGGVVVIERVFAIPGMGTFAASSAIQGDLPAVMGAVIFTVVIVVLVNLTVDLVNGWLNPKVRVS